MPLSIIVSRRVLTAVRSRERWLGRLDAMRLALCIESTPLDRFNHTAALSQSNPTQR